MKGKIIYTLNTVLIFLLIVSCTNEKVINEVVQTHNKNEIIITKEQFHNDEMVIGELINWNFKEVVVCNGKISAPVDGIAIISTQVPGIVDGIYSPIGTYVKRGSVICSLTGNELIKIQQDFLVSSVNLERLKQDYERGKIMRKENVGSEKDFLLRKSKYYTMLANYQAQKLQLELLNLDIDKIKKGDLYSSFPLKAPISGYITKQNIMVGQYIEPQKELIEIIDISSLQLQLGVFEKDIVSISIGQDVEFKMLGDKKTTHKAKISTIGKTIDNNSKMVNCIAKIEIDDHISYTYGSFIEAIIITSSNANMAVPTEAIIKSGDNNFVLVVDNEDEEKYSMQKTPVVVGKTSDNFTEIISDQTIKKILIKGNYNLQVD